MLNQTRLAYSHFTGDTQRDSVICLTLLGKSEVALCTQRWETSPLASHPLLNHLLLKFLSVAPSHVYHSSITAQVQEGRGMLYIF